MEDPTQPMFPVSEPESISAPQEPVIVTDPTPHTKKKKHNGDCMGMQLLLTGILAAAVFSLRWVNASYQTAFRQSRCLHSCWSGWNFGCTKCFVCGLAV